jgi:hypothetical protein
MNLLQSNWPDFPDPKRTAPPVYFIDDGEGLTCGKSSTLEGVLELLKLFPGASVRGWEQYSDAEEQNQRELRIARRYQKGF